MYLTGNFIKQVELETITRDPGTTLRAPTLEAGLAPACKDTCFGDLRLRLWERRYDGSEGKVCFVLSLRILVHVLVGFKSSNQFPLHSSPIVGHLTFPFLAFFFQ